MESLLDQTSIFYESLKTFGEQIIGVIPEIIGAILLILLGWIFAKLLARLVNRLLKVVKFNSLFEKMHIEKFYKSLKIDIDPSFIVARFVFWVVFLLFIVSATETLGWSVVANEITNLIRFIPYLFIGIIIFIIGLYIANFIKSMINASFSSLGISSGKIISEIAFYIIMVVITLTAIKQTGINTEFIDNNITIIIGVLVAAFALSFALSSKDVLQNILAGFYSKNNFHIGQKIRVDGKEGRIIKIDSVQFVLMNKDEKMVFPVSKFLTERIDILEEEEMND